MSMSFGEYLREKRKERSFSLKILARLIGKSKSYISQLENGTRPAPKQSTLEAISKALVLNDSENKKLFDLADQSRNTISDELSDYINTHKDVKEALQVSKNKNVPDEDWKSFLKQLKDKFMMWIEKYIMV